MLQLMSEDELYTSSLDAHCGSFGSLAFLTRFKLGANSIWTRLGGIDVMVAAFPNQALEVKVALISRIASQRIDIASIPHLRSTILVASRQLSRLSPLVTPPEVLL